MVKWVSRRIGLDTNQRLARIDIGLPNPRRDPSCETLDAVAPLLANECPTCGGSNPYPMGSDPVESCAYCGSPYGERVSLETQQFIW